MPQPSSAAGSRQKTLLLLSALAVFFVVDLHSRNAFGLMTSVFPYESFFIPLFVFIAGAFFRLEDVTGFCPMLTVCRGVELPLLVFIHRKAEIRPFI